jgi:hypothetical protein
MIGVNDKKINTHNKTWFLNQHQDFGGFLKDIRTKLMWTN